MSVTVKPSAWIGCLHCYNSGRLVGQWFTEDLHEVTVAQVHRDSKAQEGCEELWVMDHEGIPARGEMSPSEAQDWINLLEEVDEDQREAYAYWVREVAGADSPDDAATEDFAEAYRGEWDTFRDYAWDLAEESFDTDHALWQYFNIDAHIRDLQMDHAEVRGLDGVHVFLNH